MRSKFFIILVCCLLALAVLVLSRNGEQVTKAEQIKSLLITPITKTTPETTLRLILEFSTIEELQQLLLQQEEEEEEQVSYIETQGVAAANADPMTGRVWLVSLKDGLSPADWAMAGFKTITLCPTGSFSQAGVTVTVTANILGETQRPCVLYLQNDLHVEIYKDGRLVNGWSQSISHSGSQSVTSRPFTMEPNHDYYAVGYIKCRSRSLYKVKSVIAEITDIHWNF